MRIHTRLCLELILNSGGTAQPAPHLTPQRRAVRFHLPRPRAHLPRTARLRRSSTVQDTFGFGKLGLLCSRIQLSVDASQPEYVAESGRKEEFEADPLFEKNSF